MRNVFELNSCASIGFSPQFTFHLIAYLLVGSLRPQLFIWKAAVWPAKENLNQYRRNWWEGVGGDCLVVEFWKMVGPKK